MRLTKCAWRKDHQTASQIFTPGPGELDIPDYRQARQTRAAKARKDRYRILKTRIHEGFSLAGFSPD